MTAWGTRAHAQIFAHPTVTAVEVSIRRVNDAELLARAREGNTEAFGELVARHQTTVFRAALAAMGSPADAEDVTQEAFISAYTRLSSFRGDASFKTWVLTIAWNQAINRRRSLRWWWTRTVNIDAPDVALEARSDGPNPEQMASGEQFRRAVRREILRLSPKLRDTLLLAQSGEYGYEEISAMLKKPVGTIKWRVSEARRLVKVRLRARGYTHVG
jgi:RNA polymerase sigma-70 factor (ECF subfamily)